MWQSLHDAGGTATALTNYGEILMDQGKLEEARAKYEESVKTFREAGQKNRVPYPLFGIAEVLSEEGKLADAKTKYQEILKLVQETGDKHQQAYALSGLAQILMEGGDFAGARQKFEEAQATRKKAGETGAVAEAQFGLALVALYENRLEEAVRLATAALDEFAKEKMLEDEIDARSMLAETAWKSGKTAEGPKNVEPG